MDLVNSVTENSNNKKTRMENQSRQDSESEAPSMSNKDKQQHAVAMQQKNQVPEYLRAIGMDPRKFWPKKYRFTREKTPGGLNPLSISQRNFYEANGYIVMDDCVPSKLLAAVKKSLSTSTCDSNDDSAVADMLISNNPYLLRYVECFCDEKVMMMTHCLLQSLQTQVKISQIVDNELSNSQRLHRDWIYLPFRPIDKVVCAVTAIDPLDNSILVVPGTHKIGQCNMLSVDRLAAGEKGEKEADGLEVRTTSHEIFERSPRKLSSLVEKAKKGFKYVNLKPGQVLFYHPGLVHAFNDSDLINHGKKQLASIAYFAAADCEFIDMRETESPTERLAGGDLPIGLSQFRGSNPTDYTSWVNKPRLLRSSGQANL